MSGLSNPMFAGGDACLLHNGRIPRASRTTVGNLPCLPHNGRLLDFPHEATQRDMVQRAFWRVIEADDRLLQDAVFATGPPATDDRQTRPDQEPSPVEKLDRPAAPTRPTSRP
jgi:hypothetical protein